jgi:hypothetical protein
VAIVLTKEIPKSIQTFFKSLATTPTSQRPIRRRGPVATRLKVEALEERCLLSHMAITWEPHLLAQFLIDGTLCGVIFLINLADRLSV